MYLPGEVVRTESHAEIQRVVNEPDSRRGEDDPPHGRVGEVLLRAAEERQRLRRPPPGAVGRRRIAAAGLFEERNICEISPTLIKSSYNSFTFYSPGFDLLGSKCHAYDVQAKT